MDLNRKEFIANSTDPLPGMPPWNAAAEDGLIASILHENARYHEVAGTVRVEDFFGGSSRKIFGALAGLMDREGSADPITLTEALVQAGVYPRHHGLGWGQAEVEIARIMESCPFAFDAEEYAAIIREHATSRRLIEAANRILANATGRGMSAAEQLEAAERAVYAVAGDAPSDDVFTAYEAGIASMNSFLLRRDGQVPGVSTGFAQLDDMLGGGLADGGMIMVGARPSMGKTAFGLNICENAADRGIGSFFASLEMNRKELGDRLICGRAGVPSGDFRRARWLTDDQMGAVDRAARELAEVRIHISDSPSQTASRIASTARREKIAHGIGLALVDYVQFIPVEAEDLRVARAIQVANVSRRFKSLAKELDLPIVVLSQLNRDCDGREDKRPRMSDLKDSGALEQDADVVLLLHRPDYYDPADRPGVVEVIVAKNRTGPTGVVELRFVGQLTRFMDSDDAGIPDFI